MISWSNLRNCPGQYVFFCTALTMIERYETFGEFIFSVECLCYNYIGERPKFYFSG